MGKNNVILLLNKIFFSLIYTELFIGGAGRLFEFNSFLTLRMVLFLIYCPLGIILFLNNKNINIVNAKFIFLFTFLLLFSLIIGLLNNAPYSLIFEDIKPLSSFLLIFYACSIITHKIMVDLWVKLLLVSSVILATFHIVSILIMTFSDFDYLFFYNLINGLRDNEQEGTGEFFFKGDFGLFNYKGDIYMCIGLFFWDKNYPKSLTRSFILFFIFTAIILTGTRGLLLMIIATYLIEILIDRNIKKIIIYIFIFFIMIASYPFYLNFLGDKDASDLVRYSQINQVIENINPLSFLIGHGFGIGIPIRPIHMEISFLEIFHKQGLLGILIWVVLLYNTFIIFKSDNSYQRPFLLSLIFILLLSFTNPYMNHPLGLSMIVTSIACSQVLIKKI